MKLMGFSCVVWLGLVSVSGAAPEVVTKEIGSEAGYVFQWQGEPVSFLPVPGTDDEQMVVRVRGKEYRHAVFAAFQVMLSDTRVDFDRDGKEDRVISYVGSAGGSGSIVYRATFSSLTGMMRVYAERTGTTWWYEVEAPVLEDQFGFVAMGGVPEVVMDLMAEDEVLTLPETPDFLFSCRWDGSGFSYRPDRKFYVACCAKIERSLKSLRSDRDAVERGVVPVFEAMLREFRQAANGEEVTEAVLATNSWREVLKVNLGGKEEAAVAADYGVFLRGRWEVVERPVRTGDGWDNIVWRYTIGGEGDVVAVAGRKVKVDGKEPTRGEKAAKTEGTLKLVGSKALGVVIETNYKGTQLRGRWDVDVGGAGKSFSGTVYEDRKPATRLSGRWVGE